VNLTLPWLFATMVASTLGFGVFTYGRKQVRMPHIVVGVLLMIVPGFVDGTTTVWALTGASLGALWLGTRYGL
jgi:hypothetical protein